MRRPLAQCAYQVAAPQVEKEEAECGLMNAYLWGHDARLQSGKLAVVTEMHFRNCLAESVRGQPKIVGRGRRHTNTSTGRILFFPAHILNHPNTTVSHFAPASFHSDWRTIPTAMRVSNPLSAL